jgi:hypothetical protein
MISPESDLARPAQDLHGTIAYIHITKSARDRPSFVVSRFRIRPASQPVTLGVVSTNLRLRGYMVESLAILPEKFLKEDCLFAPQI